jgi:hypothetical protein
MKRTAKQITTLTLAQRVKALKPGDMLWFDTLSRAKYAHKVGTHLKMRLTLTSANNRYCIQRA